MRMTASSSSRPARTSNRWGRITRPNLYSTAFENRDVLIVERR
jgi:hypothetical protein